MNFVTEFKVKKSNFNKMPCLPSNVNDLPSMTGYGGGGGQFGNRRQNGGSSPHFQHGGGSPQQHHQSKQQQQQQGVSSYRQQHDGRSHHRDPGEDASLINGMLINISEVLSWLYRIYVNHKSCVCDTFDIARNVAKP